MGKYTEIQNIVYSVFGSDAWKAENIATYPSNFIAISTPGEFIRVSILPNGSGVNKNSASGLVLIDIFTSAGTGVISPALIADKLDLYLSNKTLSITQNSVQFKTSSFTVVGVDSSNSSLFRSTYSILFNFFGVND
jgi:hypothetical protein